MPALSSSAAEERKMRTAAARKSVLLRPRTKGVSSSSRVAGVSTVFNTASRGSSSPGWPTASAARRASAPAWSRNCEALTNSVDNRLSMPCKVTHQVRLCNGVMQDLCELAPPSLEG